MTKCSFQSESEASASRLQLLSCLTIWALEIQSQFNRKLRKAAQKD